MKKQCQICKKEVDNLDEHYLFKHRISRFATYISADEVKSGIKPPSKRDLHRQAIAERKRMAMAKGG